MAQSKALEVWNGLPNWAKGIIAVGGLAIIYFTANSVIKSIKKKKEEAVKAAQPEVRIKKKQIRV